MTFVPGLELSRRFYAEVVAPLVGRTPHAAALIGDGSEVMGFDTPVSTDHDWGPHVLVFLPSAQHEALMARLEAGLPPAFLGFPTRFPDRDRPTVATHGIELWTVEDWARRYLGGEPTTPADWLGTPEPLLLGTTGGAVFRDDDGALTALRERLSYFPRDVWLCRLAAQWRRIAEERAFVGRAAEVGDELGSRVIAARLVRDLARLAFLLERRYAPYAKWLGTAFAALPCAEMLTPLFDQALRADDWRAREAALGEAALAAAAVHRERRLPGDFDASVSAYFTRDQRVINADQIADAVSAQIADRALRAAVMGGIDQVSDSTAVTSNIARSRRAMAALFDDGEAGAVENA
jgi:hypothetical protein